MKTKNIFFVMIFLLLFSCEKKVSKTSTNNNSGRKSDTLKVTYYPDKGIKEVDLSQYEGDKSVKLYFSENGSLQQKTVNYDSYPNKNYEYNDNKKVIHQYEQGDIGGCIATLGKELFWDNQGNIQKEIIHTSIGGNCSEKVLIKENKAYYQNSKQIKTHNFTRESYEGSNEYPCGISKEFDLSGKLIKQEKFANCDDLKTTGEETVLEKPNEIPTKFYGDFYVGVETEATTNGMASISYYFSLSEKGADLKTNTYHEPIRCNGKYRGQMNSDILELFYDGNEDNCANDESDFKIKKEGKKLFIQGLGGEGTYSEWIEIKKTDDKQ